MENTGLNYFFKILPARKRTENSGRGGFVTEVIIFKGVT